MKLTVQGLARSSSLHPVKVLAVWGVILVAAGITTQKLLPSAITNDFNFTNSPESKQADDLIKSQITGEQPDTEFVIVSSTKYTAQDGAFQDYTAQLTAAMLALGPDTVASATDPLAALPSPPKRSTDVPPQSEMQFVSKDAYHVLIPVVMAGHPAEAVDKAPALQGVIHGKTANSDFQTLVFGNGTAFADQKRISEEDLRKGEMFGLMIALVVLVVVFAALIAAVVPVVMGVFAIAVAIGLMAFLGIWFDFVFFTTNMISMMGLAVGIDYSLFIVSRFREERRHGLAKLEALSVTGGTANRAVFFSGMTVVLALLGMMIVPTTIFRGLSAGAILVVSVSVAASLTLLPALLALLGDKINWPRLSRRARVEQGEIEGGMWDRITCTVMGHPVVSLVLATAFLLALASSFFSMRTGMAGVETLPDKLETKQAFLLLTEYFSGGLSSPTQIVVEADPASLEVQQGVATLTAELSKDPAFGEVGSIIPGKTGDIGVLNVAMAGDPTSSASVDGIANLRDSYLPKAFEGTGIEALVGGQTAMMKDFFATTADYTPWIFAFVLGMSFILLTVVFRSIVVPAKAILMNLLSVAAAYGLVVGVFQKGWFNGAFDSVGFHFVRVTAIDAWLPLFMFSILFGLSMDYQVFLLSRIREEYDRTGDNGEAVAFGLRTTGSIITGAALIMVAVFVSFAHGSLVALQEVGFGLAVAVFLDATVVRSVLVPSAMKLLGDRNWYLPGWLQWLPKVEIEGESGLAKRDMRSNGDRGVGRFDPETASADADRG